MKIKLLPFFLLLLQLGACSSSKFDFDDGIYGTWSDPFNVIEAVIFHEDGAVSWFGDEGTFEHYTYDDCTFWGATCNPFNGVSVSVNNSEFLVRFPRDYSPNELQINPAPCDGCDISNVGYELELLFIREGSFERPIMPNHFESIPGSLWRNRYQCPVNVVSTTPLRASQSHTDYELRGLVYDYHESTATWEIALGDGDNYYQVGKEIIIENSSNSNNFRASFDKGATWKTLPKLPTGGSLTEYTLAGTTLVTTVNVAPPCPWEQYPCSEPSTPEIWTMNATADSPSWTRRRSFTNSNNRSHRIYTHPTNGIIFWHFNGQDHAELSTDFGLTWKPLSPGYTFSVTTRAVPHLNGILFTNESDEVLWYNSNTDTWTTHHVNFDDFVTSGDLTDGAYIRRGDQIIKWQPDGSETNITTVSGSLGYGNIQVFDDQVFVDKFGLWRTER